MSLMQSAPINCFSLVMTTDSNAAVLKIVSGLMLIGTVGAAVVATGLDAITIVFWRSLIGALFLLVWCFAKGILPDAHLSSKNIWRGVIAGVSLVLSWAAFFEGILRTSISTATILFHTQPFWIVIIGAVVWKERITSSQLVWLLTAFVGVSLASNLSMSENDVDTSWLIGVLLLLGGAFVYAITAIAGKDIRNQRSEITTLIQTLAGTIIFAPFINFSQDITTSAWGLLLMIGVLQTGIAWGLVYGALPYLSTPLIAILSFVNPLTAIFSDWLFYDHLISGSQAIGMGLIVLGTLGVKLGWQQWRKL